MTSAAEDHVGRWQDRHNEAVNHRAIFQNKHYEFETPVVDMLRGWSDYARDHKARYDSPIGDDGVLGSVRRILSDGVRGLGRHRASSVLGALLEV